MKFRKWITRRGITGITSREVGKFYVGLKKQNPQMEPRQLAAQVCSHFSSGYSCHGNLRILIEHLVRVKQGRLFDDRPGAVMVLEMEVIEEELAKLGVPKDVVF